MEPVKLGAWRSSLLCLSLFLLLEDLQAFKFSANPAAKLSSDQKTLIEQLWKPELVLPEKLIRKRVEA